MANWAELNQDLLILIAKRVGFLEDFSTFGRVCRSWRSVAVKKNFKGSQQVLWLMLTEETNDEKPDNKVADYRCFVSAADGNLTGRLMLPEAKGMQCFESLGWFVTLSETGDMNLLHPLSRVQIPLPHISALENRDEVNADRICKAVLSSRPSPFVENNYALMVIYNKRSMGPLGLWKPEKKAWTTIKTRGYYIVDITYYKGQFYAVTDRGGNILICDVWGSDHPTIVGEKRIPHLAGLDRSLYIVESEGELLIIVRYFTALIFYYSGERVGRGKGKGNGVNINDDETRFGGTEEFRVYKVDLSNSTVAELQSLGDNTLFVGYKASISVQTSNSSQGIRPNCIYYSDVCRIGGTAFGFSVGGRQRKNDQLIEIPDGVLSTIISMLTLKDAVRTSVVSKQWRFIWICHSDLWFDSANVLGKVVSSKSISESEKKLQTYHYSSTASEGSEEYEFPIRLLAAAGEKSSVKHLELTSCSLIAPLDSNSLTSLVTIQLENVKIGDEQLESLLSSCLFLEGLSLHLCNCLFELNFIAPNLRLKRLSIHNCFRLQKMELRTKNLALFEYTGHLILFYFKDVPRLAEAFLNFTTDSRLDGAAYALTKFVSDVPQLETLNLVSVLAMKVLKLPETVPTTFTNIRELVLTIFPFDDEDKLCWSNYILKNFPLLYKLQLNLFCANFIKQPNKIERVLQNCPHNQLTELEINGFYGNHHEQVLLKYLLDNLAELKVLAVSPCQKVYKGFNSWLYEEANSWYEVRMESVCEWLDAVVPSTVRLEVR
ncbi:hypothetical protein RHMOL_Rhmol02G0266800 [Rhododendron molle]|uniref:Uncharacterized protein n=1 Tax=Rhododendron molle TaxID=49168 RepID=A0ACC0PW93_RHOML|nr:hypothetical protein RHMOL_Rhmol02G0266800 [Rhododendron molle]